MITSTFGGFTTAQLALLANQRAIDVAGQNLSNMNTVGYTRQRLDFASISPAGNGAANSPNDCKVGQGVEMTGVTQIRDPYLDIQYRNQLTKVGTADAMDSILERVGDIFDETDSEALRAALNDVISQFQTMANPATASESTTDSMVRASFEVLLNMFHQKGSEISGLREEQEGELQKSLVPNLNEALKKITELNKTIKNTQVLGNPALELIDERNLLIDDLATYLPIEVNYKRDTNPGAIVDYLEISFKDSKGNKHLLVSDDEAANFACEKGADGKLSLKLSSNMEGKAPVTDLEITETLGDGVLKSKLDMLNKAEIFDGTNVKGIGYYEGIFNTFVSALATTMNSLNEKNGVKNDLFTTSDGSTEFTAENIQISKEWMKGDVKITLTQDDTAGGTTPTTKYDNVLKIIESLTSAKYDFKDATGKVVFKGSMQGIFDSIQNTQAIERSSSNSILQNRTLVLNRLADSKDGISAVSQDEEVMDLMRYQQSYNAASKLITTLDEMLDKLINQTGVVGR